MAAAAETLAEPLSVLVSEFERLADKGLDGHGRLGVQALGCCKVLEVAIHLAVDA